MLIAIYYIPSSVPDSGQKNEEDTVPARKKVTV